MDVSTMIKFFVLLGITVEAWVQSQANPCGIYS